MTDWARIGISQAGFSRPRSGVADNPADFAGAVGKMVVSNLSSAGPGSAVFSVDSSGAVEGGGKSGELLLRVRLARHPDFSVEGSDLVHEVKIAPWQATLGDQLIVPTLEGSARLKLPPGTQGGQRFRLRGRGLPGVSGQRGDLYVVVQISIPKKLSEGERELWEQLAQLHGREESG